MIKSNHPIFLSSDWETANIEDVKEYLRVIEAMNKDGIIIISRLGDYKQTTDYLNLRIDSEK